MHRTAAEMTATPYDKFEVGTAISGSTSLDEDDIEAAASLFGDYNPIHMDRRIAESSVHGRRILHGPCVAGLMMATVGNAVAGTGIGELDLSLQFKAPSCPGDTLTWTWTVVDKAPKPKYDGGIVIFDGTCRNQDDVTVITATTKVLVTNRIPGA